MKKFIGLFLAGMLVLSGCSSSKDKGGSVTCTLDQDGTNVEIALGYNSDKILNKITEEVKVTSEIELSDEDLSMAESLYDSMFGKVDGITYKIKAADNKKDVTVTIDIDLEKYDFEKDELGMFSTLDEKEDVKKVDIKDMISIFEDEGAKCGSVK